MVFVQGFEIPEFPAPEELLPLYQAAVADNNAALLSAVDQMCADYFAIDAEDLPTFCKQEFINSPPS